MAFEVSIKPIALIDIDEAIAWYEAELKGLGSKFLKSIKAGTKSFSKKLSV